MTASSWKQIWRIAVSDGVPTRSLGIAIAVGTILNAINQGDTILAGVALNWAKIVLTCLVPHCVSTYGAVSYQLRVVAR